MLAAKFRLMPPSKNIITDYGIEFIEATLTPLCAHGKILSEILFDAKGMCVDEFQPLLNRHHKIACSLTYDSKVHLLFSVIKAGNVENMIYMFEKFMTPFLGIYDKETSRTTIEMGWGSHDPYMGVAIRRLVIAQQQELEEKRNTYKERSSIAFGSRNETKADVLSVITDILTGLRKSKSEYEANVEDTLAPAANKKNTKSVRFAL